MSTTPQRMSDERLAYVTEYLTRCAVAGDLVAVNQRTANEILQALIAERAVVDELKEGLRSCDCPRPLMPDRTIGACVDTGMCGCVHSTQLQTAINPKE